MKKQYKANGGNMNDLGQVLSAIAPLAALIPGAGAVVSPALGMAGGLMQQQQGPTTPRLAGSKYAKGGKIDTQLNSTAFKVNGNPNVKDSEYYPTMGVHLDNDEVIDTQNNFAFSNRITNPYTNNTFAKDASRFHKAIGKSEKRAAFSSGDSFSEKTIEHSKKQTDKLAGLQEIVASVQGLRNSAPAYAMGGPMDPPKVTQNDFQNQGTPYSKGTQIEESGRSILRKGARGQEVTQLQAFLKNKGMYKGEVDGIFGDLTEQAVKGYQDWYNKNAEGTTSYVQNGNPVVTGKGHKKVAVDGIVGDETRSALMYRQMPKEAPKKQEAPQKMGELGTRTINYNVTEDGVIKGEPDYYNVDLANFINLTALTAGLGGELGALGSGAEELGLGSRIYTQMPKSVRLPKQIPTGGNTVPNPSNMIPRSFAPKTPSAYGTRIGYATGGNLPSYAGGGPFDPLPNQPYMELFKTPIDGIQIYYDPYNKRQVMRAPNTGEYMPVNREYPNLPSDDLIKAHIARYPGTVVPDQPKPVQTTTPLEIPPAYIGQTGTPYPYDINPLNPTTPRDTPKPWTLDPTDGMGKPRTTTPVTPTVPPRGTKRPTTSKKPVLPVVDRNGVKPPVMDDTFPDMNNLGLGAGYKSTPRSYMPEAQVSEADYGSVSFNNLPQYGTPPGMGSLNGKLTAGDYMQLATVGSRIYDAFRKPEVEVPNLDETAITKQAYDPATQLAQSSRNYSTTLNSLSTNSPNLRRAMANQAYASKLGQDADVIEKYDQMNKQSQTQYEDRLSNRRRFNTSKIDMTNDLNARNRGAAMNARTAAFDTVGNTGQALNQRKTAYDTLALQAQLYPDVYQRFIQEYILNGQ